MRKSTYGIAAIVAFFAVFAIAQSTDPVTTVISGNDLEALLMQEGGDNPLRVVNSPDGQFGVFVLSTQPRAASDTVNGGYHSEIGEIYHVVNGTGVFVTGGELIDPEEVEMNTNRYTRAGPGASGRLRNPQLVEYGPGSIFIVPPGVPHNAAHEVRTKTDIIVYRFDPNRVLPQF